MVLPENAVTTLRVLTRKSRLGFGKHADKTVADILICQPTYIPWAYYRLPAISFSDDILDEADIIRIQKPGTDEETYRRYLRDRSARYTQDERNHYFWKKQRTAKKVAGARLIRSIRLESYSKAELQSINHGHVKCYE